MLNVDAPGQGNMVDEFLHEFDMPAGAIRDVDIVGRYPTGARLVTVP